MKHRRGCQSCRLRHRKCAFPEDGRACFGCLETGSVCLPPPKFIFTFAPQSARADVDIHQNDKETRGQRYIQPTSDLGSRSERIGPSGLLLNLRESQLFMMYVKQLAPMMDSCDEARHFTLTVPRLALREPMLLNSILAMASRYDALHKNVPPDIEAIQYNQKSIKWLLASFSKPPSTYGSELLAAVVLTRSYEECDFEADLSHFHLSGTKNLLSYDKVAQIASRGGLAEAACWVHLRQAIYAYLVRRRPVDPHIDAFKNLAAFGRTDDSAYANHMVYHFVRILRLFLQSPCAEKRVETKDTWASLQTDIDGWFNEKPPSFSPIFATCPDELQFPTLVMLSSASVIGLQYYHAANIIIQLKWAREQNSPGDDIAFNQSKDWEICVSDNMCTLMGLAFSNDHVLDSFLLPMHMLYICGHCIRNHARREKTLLFLKRANELIQWTTSSLANQLTKQWGKEDSLIET